VVNAARLAAHVIDDGATLITGGIDNHRLLSDCVRSWGIGGREAEELFDRIGVTLNKNVIADDPRKPMDPSGIRLGTPAVTSRGMKEAEMERLADFMLAAVARRDDEAALNDLHQEVKAFCKQYPLPGVG